MAEVSKFVFQPDNITVNVRDNTARTNINNEISARQQADNTLQSNIDAEATTRANADSAIQNSILAIGNQITELTEEISVKSNLIKPEEFGAIGDGVTDDTEALNDCIEYAYENGKYVLLTQTYYVTGKVYLKTGVNIYGNGTVNYDYVGDTVNRNTLYCFDCSNQSNITIEGVNFTGTGHRTTYTYSVCIGGINATNITITKCRILESPDLACILFDDSEYIDVSLCIIKDYTYAGMQFVEGSSHISVRKCVVMNGHHTNQNEPNRYGISLSGFYTPVPTGSRKMGNDLLCEGCYLSDTKSFWEGIDAHGGIRIRILNNIVMYMGESIAVFTDTDRKFSASQVVVKGNICINGETAMESGSAVAYASVFSGDVMEISDNYFNCGNIAFAQTQYNGIAIAGSNIEFKNNTVENCGKYALYVGNPTVNSAAIFIKNNSLRVNDTTNAIILHGVAGSNTHTYVFIEENDIIAGKLFDANSLVTNNNSYFWFKDNIYRNLVPTFTYVGIIPDIATPQTISSCRGIANQRVMNLAPTAGGYIGWVYISNAWKGYGTIAS